MIDTDIFKNIALGIGADDTFTFKMKDGEKVKVRAVKEDVNGAILNL